MLLASLIQLNFLLIVHSAMSHVCLRDGLKIGIQRWGSSSSCYKFCMLHGWMDNSNSFSYIGPKLGELGFDVVAIDHLGHGQSSGFKGIPHFLDYGNIQAHSSPLLIDT